MTVNDLLSMSRADLDALFTSLESGAIPDGSAEGTAIIAPGTSFTGNLAQLISIFGWQGKVFDAKRGVLRNRILPFGLNAIIATISRGASWHDQKECIVLDYSDTSLIAQWVRDEIRMIAPGFYLGKAYWDEEPLIHFALQFSDSAR
jgi:hypothetical protein